MSIVPLKKKKKFGKKLKRCKILRARQNFVLFSNRQTRSTIHIPQSRILGCSESHSFLFFFFLITMKDDFFIVDKCIIISHRLRLMQSFIRHPSSSQFFFCSTMKIYETETETEWRMSGDSFFTCNLDS